MAKQILLSIAMLASRNRAQVKRCLDSLCPILERIPSELLIVDTSKDAQVHELCLKYTDRVEEFDWCSDFSAARNVSVRMARGEWYLFVDDDEWFVEYEELVSFFVSGKYKEYGCANYIQRNFHDEAGTFYSDNWVSRIIKLYPQTRFYSKIHEYIAPQIGQCINLHAVVNHTGYIAQTREAKLKKFERNYPLLLEMLKEEPKRLRWRVHIIQELNNVQKWEEMQNFCQESIQATTDCTDKEDYRDIGTFYAGLLTSLVERHLYDAAFAVEKALEMDKRLSRLCRVYCALLLARLHFARRDCAATRKQLDIYEEGGRYLGEHESEREEQESALLVGAALDEMNRRRALSLRIGCGLLENDTSVLRENYEGLGWKQQVMYVSDDLFPVLMEAMARMPEDGALLDAMQDLWNNREAAEKLFSYIEGKKTQDEPSYRTLFRMTARMSGEFWYIWYAKLLVADWENADADYTELFAAFCRYTPNVFMTPELLTEIVKRHGGTVETGYLSLPYKDFLNQLLTYSENAPFSDIQIAERELVSMKTKEAPHYDYAFLYLALTRLQKGRDYAALSQGLVDFGTHGAAFAYKYFQAQVLEEYPELLPPEVQAGLWVSLALDAAKSDRVLEMQYLDRAARALPALAKPIAAYLRLRESQARKEREELRQLAAQIKDKVQECVDTGLYREALQILDELQKITEHDLDVARLRLCARIGMIGNG